MDDWTSEVVGRMHHAGITGLRLADECGYTNSYLSAILHGRKGSDKSKQTILDALARLEAQALTKESS